MIVIRRVIRSNSFARFASGGAIVHEPYYGRDIGKEEAYGKKFQKAVNRRDRRNQKLEQRSQYKQPNPSYSPDPNYEYQSRKYQYDQAVKNAPDPNAKWKDVAEDMGKAREKFSQTANDVKNSVKPDFSSKSKLNPKLLLAGLGIAGAVGAGAYFIRKRRSKNGKQIIERVRR